MPPPWQSSVPREYSRGDVSGFDQLICPQAVKCYKDEGIIKITFYSQKTKPNQNKISKNKIQRILKNKLKIHNINKTTKFTILKKNWFFFFSWKRIVLCHNWDEITVFIWIRRDQSVLKSVVFSKFSFIFKWGYMWCMFYANWMKSRYKLYQ